MPLSSPAAPLPRINNTQTVKLPTGRSHGPYYAHHCLVLVHEKKKKSATDTKEATASKIVHRNVVIIRNSSVETLSITQKLYFKSIRSRTLKMNIRSFQAVFVFFFFI